MVAITLPDGSVRQEPTGVSVADVAQQIGARLAKAALAARVNGQLVDLSHQVQADAAIEIITAKDPAGLEIIRHSCAHLLAQALKACYPSAQIAIGPVIEDGFYYDVALPHSLTEQDLSVLEQKMHELAAKDVPVKRLMLDRDDALQLFKSLDEKYKVQIIQEIPAGEQISAYQQGEFIDLCRGPHVPRTGLLKAFKLTKLAGAYWRGDSRNEMLQRIYGTAWGDDAALQAYLKRLEEAKKRDHRELSKRMDLYHIQEEAPGMIFWHPNGWVLFRAIENYMREQMRTHGYQEVRTPQIIDRSLWEKSGHWAKFGDDMFTLRTDERDYAIKPMNCPGHVQIFNQGIKSYRDLPLRLSEFGSCHRNEGSGALHGLMRVRNFVQDDAHIFCTEDQIFAEVSDFIDLLFTVYRDFGFHDVEVRLATRPVKRVGSDESWDKAENALQQAIERKQLNWRLMVGEGAFYGPKIEFVLKDCIGRLWTTGSVQLDFSMPERLSAHYIDSQGQKQVAVMLHRAIFGSLERFIGILIEDTAGFLPTWLAPLQVVVLPITDVHADYATALTEKLQNLGIRCKFDLRNEKISFKIREHTLARVPYALVVGDQEVAQNQVTVRNMQTQSSQAMTFGSFSEQLLQEIQQHNRERRIGLLAPSNEQE